MDPFSTRPRIDLDLDEYDDRPRTRGECGVERPCPFATCKYSLLTDVSRRGQHRSDPETGRVHDRTNAAIALGRTCALDVAEEGGVTLQEVADLLGVTREAVRQIEIVAIRKLRARTKDNAELRDRLLVLTAAGDHEAAAHAHMSPTRQADDVELRKR